MVWDFAMAWIGSRRALCLSSGWLLAALGAATPAHAAVTISSAATSNVSCVSGVCSPTAANAVLNVGDLTSMLASGSVTVNTGTGSLAAEVEDIDVAAPFNWANTGSLTLDAYRSVTVTAPVAVNGAAPVSLVTNDGGSGGNLSFISGGSLSFLSTANGLSINGTAYTLENSVATLAAAIAHKSSGHYALSANYDASHDGTHKGSPIPSKFKGTFDGLGNTISNLSIGGKNKEIGLFAHVDAEGKINSILVTGASIVVRDSNERTSSYAGVLVAANFGVVSNAFASGRIEGAFGKSGLQVGGLVGFNWGVIIGSGSSTTVLAAESRRGLASAAAGGLAGLNDDTIENSYATGNVSIRGGSSDFSGGLVGHNVGPVENSYAEGAVVAANSSFGGGLAGGTYSTMSDSYSTGTVTGGDGSLIGGFVGVDGTDDDLSSNYWDTTTSGINNLSQGAGRPANDAGITGETTAQLQAALPSGFDPTVWAQSPSINNGLPYLIANPPQ
jgi:hypothetical protein